jgi:protein tyrosine/serine phosphatase
LKFVGASFLALAMSQAPCLAGAPPPDLGITSDLASERASADAQLRYFGEVDEGVYKGSKPASDADYRFLQSLHVKYIVVLRVLPFTHRAEKREAKKFGITLIQEEMNASPFPPSQRYMEEILAVLRDARYHPVYFHCAFGRDRTSVIAALYEMYFKGLPPEQAMRFLHESGYKDGWVRSGLTRYVKKHPTAPTALLSLPDSQSRLR